VPRPTVFTDGKQRMLQALAEKRQRQEQPSHSTALQRALSVVRSFGTRGPARVPAFRTALAVVMVIALFGFVSLVMLSRPGGLVDQVASVAHVSGIVELLPAGSETWQPLPADDQVQEGDRVRTGPRSAAMLLFFDGSTSSLGAQADVTIAQMRSRQDGDGRAIVLQQHMGQTYNVVQPDSNQAAQFEIDTPAAVIVVSGTEFEVSVESGGTTDVTVVVGDVDVTAQGTTVRVSAGLGVTVSPEQTPSGTRSVSINTPTPWPASGPADAEPTEVQAPSGSDETPAPTDTAEPTETPTPTGTPTLTATATLTGTPTPTETPVPIATPVPPATSEPPETPRPTNTRRPHPTHPPHPTPKPTKTPRPRD
jgi:ferric-dicitrate binding protein FerR (iron transport regulator)